MTAVEPNLFKFIRPLGHMAGVFESLVLVNHFERKSLESALFQTSNLYRETARDSSAPVSHLEGTGEVHTMAERRGTLEPTPTARIILWRQLQDRHFCRF